MMLTLSKAGAITFKNLNAEICGDLLGTGFIKTTALAIVLILFKE
jgi:hypothetical protein